MIMKRHSERMMITFFQALFVFGHRPWKVADPKSRDHMGVGAFNMVRRSVYDAVGTYRALRMEVLDDMKLSKLTKRAGFRSQVGYSPNHVSVRWQTGIGNLVRGSSKTFFAAASYNLGMLAGQILGLLILSVFPWVVLPFVHGDARIFAVTAVAISFACHAVVSYSAGASPLYGFTHPIGALIFSWMLARSAFLTLWRGGVTWRGTFYPLADLRRGLV